MRVVSLSDHPGAMRREAQQRRAAADREAQQAHEKVLAVRRERLPQARAARDEAWAARRWTAWLRGVFAVRRARRQIPAIRLPASQPTVEEERWAAGSAGELLIACGLAWRSMTHGPCSGDTANRGGEIDHLLLGPRGLFAIEVKNQNARVECDGDRWWSTKYDRYGNPVEPRRQMADRRGRSPSVQLNEPASQLEGFLGTRGHPVNIGRVVVLIHPRAQLRSCTRPTVHIFTSVQQILGLLNASPVSITAAGHAELERVIVRDHHFHERRRSP